MGNATLLVDFGASRVKCVLWSDTRGVLAARECPAPAPRTGPGGEVEIDPQAYWDALEATAGDLLRDSAARVEALWLCTEMHGAIVASALDGAPSTAYISWRDARATQAAPAAASTYERLLPQGAAFFAASGMALRPGLPFVTLAHLRRSGALAPEFRLFTLCDWLLWRGGERDPAIHASLAAGTGLFDIGALDWSPQLLRLAGLQEHAVRLPRIAASGAPLGRIDLGGRSIAVFGGLGDLQAAAHGAGFPRAAALIVNLGTGSQVLGQVDAAPDAVERRPGAGGGQFAAVTHIPSGRALNVFAALFDDCAAAAGGRPFFWDRFAALPAAAVLAAAASVDLNVFEAAWRYKDGGAIGAIKEGHFSLDGLLAALAHSWLAQYALAIDRIDPGRTRPSFLLAGGLSRRAPFILPVLEQLTGRRGVFGATATGEETLDGLMALAARAAPAAPPAPARQNI